MDLIKNETEKSESKAYIEDAFNDATRLIKTCVEKLPGLEAGISVQEFGNAMEEARENDSTAEKNRTKIQNLLDRKLRKKDSQKKKYVEFYFIPENIYKAYETIKDQLCEDVALDMVLALLLRFQHKSISVSLQRNPLFYDQFPYAPVSETTWKELPLNSLAFGKTIGQLQPTAQNSEFTPLMLFVLMDSDCTITATCQNSVSKKFSNRWNFDDGRLLLKESNAAGTLWGILKADAKYWKFTVEKTCQVSSPGRPSTQSAQSSSSGVTLANNHPQAENDITRFQSQKGTSDQRTLKIGAPERKARKGFFGRCRDFVTENLSMLRL
ncbi:hypothetical protein BDQ12DRAFT_666939 [Crucibulum laeve]|uniref:Uncharacterized protein n=1 Tax=Crucibulum laeve TaxID=68775 RepID=A0A5C3M004_9AGAR|nr:hypothetical protein BDQ12DRAFT_666939 [Crucibulum laeve]